MLLCIVGLRKEHHFVEAYSKELEGPHDQTKKRSHVRGIVFGMSQSIPFFAYGGCMFYGGYLVYAEGIKYKVVFKVNYHFKYSISQKTRFFY